MKINKWYCKEFNRFYFTRTVNFSIKNELELYQIQSMSSIELKYYVVIICWPSPPLGSQTRWSNFLSDTLGAIWSENEENGSNLAPSATFIQWSLIALLLTLMLCLLLRYASLQSSDATQPEGILYYYCCVYSASSSKISMLGQWHGHHVSMILNIFTICLSDADN